MNTDKNDDRIIQQMKCWLESVVIDLNFCPFAQREFINQRIHYEVSNAGQLEDALQALADGLLFLEQHEQAETSLLMFSTAFADFDSFIELIDFADQLIDELGFRGQFQIAHFHPDYCFADAEITDPANFTNRAPWPTLHLLREASLQKAVASYPDTAKIPEDNITLARQLGFDKMRALLDHCRH